MDDLKTTRAVAQELGVPFANLQQFLTRHPGWEPKLRIGGRRLWRRGEVVRLGREIAKHTRPKPTPSRKGLA